MQQKSQGFLFGSLFCFLYAIPYFLKIRFHSSLLSLRCRLLPLFHHFPIQRQKHLFIPALHHCIIKFLLHIRQYRNVPYQFIVQEDFFLIGSFHSLQAFILSVIQIPLFQFFFRPNPFILSANFIKDLLPCRELMDFLHIILIILKPLIQHFIHRT